MYRDSRRPVYCVVPWCLKVIYWLLSLALPASRLFIQLCYEASNAKFINVANYSRSFSPWRLPATIYPSRCAPDLQQPGIIIVTNIRARRARRAQTNNNTTIPTIATILIADTTTTNMTIPTISTTITANTNNTTITTIKAINTIACITINTNNQSANTNFDIIEEKCKGSNIIRSWIFIFCAKIRWSMEIMLRWNYSDSVSGMQDYSVQTCFSTIRNDWFITARSFEPQLSSLRAQAGSVCQYCEANILMVTMMPWSHWSHWLQWL